jgi:diadenosine tetraphosphate (Ap4A) HIT family hydrolase
VRRTSFFIGFVLVVDNDCIFCKIIAGKVPSQRIAENDSLIVIKDIAPKTSIHYLIIPKKHIVNIQFLAKEDISLAGDIFLMAKELASQLSGSQAFRLVSNNGADSGQKVFHLHIHFLAGKHLSDF